MENTVGLTKKLVEERKKAAAAKARESKNADKKPSEGSGKE